MWTLKWFLFLPLCFSCTYTFMFSSLSNKAKEPQGKVPHEGHFRIRQGRPEQSQGWLGSIWLWLFFVMLYVILKFLGKSENSKELNPRDLGGCSLHSPLKKDQNASPSQSHAFNTLTELETDLIKLVSKVRNLRVDMAAGSDPELQNLEMPENPHNVTIYDIWCEEDCD
ncbi:protein FAM209-like [Manis pentadactyla]|uniref:protein FAM209-like n=1 Tax=Manis pentadactyla TaxID=143292 RepID=UPI00255C8168|nr:protein FAM209-like [Manis pentadactyla]KAI5279750.1 hypothetical protein MUG91_G120n107 [Manis pentadactyla]